MNGLVDVATISTLPFASVVLALTPLIAAPETGLKSNAFVSNPSTFTVVVAPTTGDVDDAEIFNGSLPIVQRMWSPDKS